MIEFKKDDGGREASGRKGSAGDCVCRAIAIAASRPYEEVYARLAAGNKAQRQTKRMRNHKSAGKESASLGIFTTRKWFKDYMRELGFEWFPCMSIGSGCAAHLSAAELPPGRLVVMVSKHACAVIDGVLRDTHDCSRGGTRCVYGYWKKA